MLATLGLAPFLLEPSIRRSLGTRDIRDSMVRLMPCLIEMYEHGAIEDMNREQMLAERDADLGSQHDPLKFIFIRRQKPFDHRKQTMTTSNAADLAVTEASLSYSWNAVLLETRSR